MLTRGTSRSACACVFRRPEVEKEILSKDPFVSSAVRRGRLDSWFGVQFRHSTQVAEFQVSRTIDNLKLSFLGFYSFGFSPKHLRHHPCLCRPAADAQRASQPPPKGGTTLHGMVAWSRAKTRLARLRESVGVEYYKPLACWRCQAEVKSYNKKGQGA